MDEYQEILQIKELLVVIQAVSIIGFVNRILTGLNLDLHITLQLLQIQVHVILCAGGSTCMKFCMR